MLCAYSDGLSHHVGTVEGHRSMVFRRKAIKGDRWLTQYGNRNRPIGGRPFKNHPPDPETANALSLILGHLSVAEAAARLRPSRRPPSSGSVVRYTTAAQFIRAGFSARHTGNNQNPLHVSVMCMDESHEWTDDDSARFDSCFSEPVWEEG